jgi:hypothetical protein
MVTAAPGITAPDVSITMPSAEALAVAAWPWSLAGNASVPKINTKNTHRVACFIPYPPNLEKYFYEPYSTEE